MVKPRNCSPHTGGVDPTAPKTFDPECPKCLELKAAGKRTGDEPRPMRHAQRVARQYMHVQHREGLAKRKATP